MSWRAPSFDNQRPEGQVPDFNWTQDAEAKSLAGDGCSLKGCARGGRGDGDHSFDAFARYAVAQVGGAVLGDDDAGVAAGGGDGAGELCDDAGGGDQDERNAARRVVGGADEVGGAADGADVAAFGDLAVDLAGQVDFYGGIDGGEALEAAEGFAIVGVFGGAQANRGVVAREIEE